MSTTLTTLTNLAVRVVSITLSITGWLFIIFAALNMIKALYILVTSGLSAALVSLVGALLFAFGGRWILRKKEWLLGLYVTAVEKRRPNNEELERKVIELSRVAVNKIQDWKAEGARHNLFVSNLKLRSKIDLLHMHVLGGEGWEFLSKKDFIFSYDNEFVYLSDEKTFEETHIPLRDLTDVSLSGPGTVTQGIRFSGGGFGVDGFVEGATIATLLNVLTTRETTKTIVRIGLQDSEIILLNSDIEPNEMRVRLSKLFVVGATPQAIPPSIPNDISASLATLAELRSKGSLSEQEFAEAKRKVLN